MSFVSEEQGKLEANENSHQTYSRICDHDLALTFSLPNF